MVLSAVSRSIANQVESMGYLDIARIGPVLLKTAGSWRERLTLLVKSLVSALEKDCQFKRHE